MVLVNNSNPAETHQKSLQWCRHDNYSLESSVQLIISAPCNFCWLNRLSTRRGFASSEPVRSVHFPQQRSMVRSAVLVSWRGLHHHSGVTHDSVPSPDSSEHLSLSLALSQSVRLIQMLGKPLWMLNGALQRLSRRWSGSCEWRGSFHGSSVCLKWLKTTQVKDGVGSTYTDPVWSLHTRRAC